MKRITNKTTVLRGVININKILLKILAYIIVIILYIISLSITLGVIYTGLNSLIGLITTFNIKDLVTFLLVVIFSYWIIKTS